MYLCIYIYINYVYIYMYIYIYIYNYVYMVMTWYKWVIKPFTMAAPTMAPPHRSWVAPSWWAAACRPADHLGNHGYHAGLGLSYTRHAWSLLEFYCVISHVRSDRVRSNLHPQDAPKTKKSVMFIIICPNQWGILHVEKQQLFSTKN